MQCPDQDPSPRRQPNVLPFTASEKCYPGNLGLRVFQPEATRSSSR